MSARVVVRMADLSPAAAAVVLALLAQKKATTEISRPVVAKGGRRDCVDDPRAA